jgi:UDP-3-O-[3-hydroxymyristoyl] glucosamine N-acyltransferase
MVRANPPSAADIRDAAAPGGEVRGDAGRAVVSARPLSALEHGCMTFLSRAPAGGLADLGLEQCTLICRAETADALAGVLESTTLIVAENPRLAFMRAVRSYFLPPAPGAGVHPSAVIDPTAQVDPTAAVGAFCFIGPDCSVGPRSVLGAGVTLVANVCIGAGVSIAGGTVIGADGFGYERNEMGELEKFPHIGGVVIEDEVEIGSNTSIDRGTLEATRIGKRARIDNQVHIAHNVIVGADAAIIAQAMIGGSVRIGERAWIAPSATVMNQIAIGADATVGLGAVVVKDVPEGATVMGSPAQDDADFRRTRAALKRLVTNE